MTFEEYYEKSKSNSGMTPNTLSYGECIIADICDQFLFPNAYDENYYYEPFTYNAGSFSELFGGDFARRVAKYIFLNYRDAILLSILSENYEGYVITIKSYVDQLIRRYKYKWHGLYETMQVDSEYDMLDNVNEITTENTTRTPDIDKVIDETVNEGAQTIGDNFTRGAVSGTNTTQFGQQGINGLSGTSAGVYPFDDDTNEHIRDTNSTNYSETHVAHNDQTNYSEQARSDSNNRTVGAKQDTKTVVESETGTEETEFERRRHGNIGVTTSGQLIRDYRLTHDFDLVRIVAEDIAKELFIGWC